MRWRGGGTGAEARRPLGLAVIGGLIVSQILTLYITPVIYLYLDRFHSRFTRRRPAGGQQKLVPEPQVVG